MHLKGFYTALNKNLWKAFELPWKGETKQGLIAYSTLVPVLWISWLATLDSLASLAFLAPLALMGLSYSRMLQYSNVR